MAIQNNMQSVSDYSRAMSSVLQRLTTDGSASGSLLHSAVSVWFIRSQLFSRLQGMSPKIQLKRRTQNLKLNSTHFKTKTKNKKQKQKQTFIIWHCSVSGQKWACWWSWLPHSLW